MRSSGALVTSCTRLAGPLLNAALIRALSPAIHRSRGIDRIDAVSLALSRRSTMIVSLRLPVTSSALPIPPASGEFGSTSARLSEPTRR